MTQHQFLFTSALWLGEGTICLNMMEDELPYYTRWKVEAKDPSGILSCTQEIQISGLSEIMHNEFSLYDFEENGFNIKLENQNLGKVVGNGMIKPDLIGWEFRLNALGFEGFEFFEKVGEDTYKNHAEYATTDDFRTKIHGRIWKAQDQNA